MTLLLFFCLMYMDYCLLFCVSFENLSLIETASLLVWTTTALEQDGTTAAVIQGLGFWGLTRTTAQSCLFLQKTIMVSKDLFLPGSPRAVCCLRYSFRFSDGSKLSTNCISFVLKFAFDLLLLNYHNCFILHFHFKYDN